MTSTGLGPDPPISHPYTSVHRVTGVYRFPCTIWASCHPPLYLSVWVGYGRFWFAVKPMQGMFMRWSVMQHKQELCQTVSFQHTWSSQGSGTCAASATTCPHFSHPTLPRYVWYFCASSLSYCLLQHARKMSGWPPDCKKCGVFNDLFCEIISNLTIFQGMMKHGPFFLWMVLRPIEQCGNDANVRKIGKAAMARYQMHMNEIFKRWAQRM